MEANERKKEGLTIEKFRTIMGTPDISDEDAQEIVSAIKAFARIVVDIQYEQDLKEKNNSENNLKQAA